MQVKTKHLTERTMRMKWLVALAWVKACLLAAILTLPGEAGRSTAAGDEGTIERGSLSPTAGRRPRPAQRDLLRLPLANSRLWPTFDCGTGPVVTLENVVKEQQATALWQDTFPGRLAPRRNGALALALPPRA